MKTLILLFLTLNFFSLNTSYAQFDIKAKTAILQDFLSGKILYEKELLSN